MQKTINRKSVWSRSPKFAPEIKHKILTSEEVLVQNPNTKEDESHIVNTYKEESVIDPHLRASDFSLHVIMQHSPQQLKDCGRFFTPENPEEYVDMVASLSARIQAQIDKEQADAASLLILLLLNHLKLNNYA